MSDLFDRLVERVRAEAPAGAVRPLAKPLFSTAPTPMSRLEEQFADREARPLRPGQRPPVEPYPPAPAAPSEPAAPPLDTRPGATHTGFDSPSVEEDLVRSPGAPGRRPIAAVGPSAILLDDDPGPRASSPSPARSTPPPVAAPLRGEEERGPVDEALAKRPPAISRRADPRPDGTATLAQEQARLLVPAPPVARRGAPSTSSPAGAGSPPSPRTAAAPLAARDEEPPVVHVTIGRIDVRALTPAQPPPRPTAPAPRGPAMSLDQFLAERERGGRS